MASVYIETTIPTFFYETRTDARSIAWRESTRRWWQLHRDRYEIVSSAIVLSELRQAPADKSAALESMIADLPMLPEAPGLVETAEFYLEHRLLPRDAPADALHLAMASIHSIDYLLTWNIRHLANANKTRHLNMGVVQDYGTYAARFDQ